MKITLTIITATLLTASLEYLPVVVVVNVIMIVIFWCVVIGKRWDVGSR